jgi:hypothetical protein
MPFRVRAQTRGLADSLELRRNRLRGHGFYSKCRRGLTGSWIAYRAFDIGAIWVERYTIIAKLHNPESLLEELSTAMGLRV